jgi:hypothetical protein
MRADLQLLPITSRYGILSIGARSTGNKHGEKTGWEIDWGKKAPE